MLLTVHPAAPRTAPHKESGTHECTHPHTRILTYTQQTHTGTHTHTHTRQAHRHTYTHTHTHAVLVMTAHRHGQKPTFFLSSLLAQGAFRNGISKATHSLLEVELTVPTSRDF